MSAPVSEAEPVLSTLVPQSFLEQKGELDRSWGAIGIQDLLSSLALCNNAFYLIQSAVCARGTMFNNVATHFSGSTALAGL